jgi:hypothetical protein
VELFDINQFKGIVPRKTFDLTIHGQCGSKRVIRSGMVKHEPLLIDQSVIDQVTTLAKFIRKRYGKFQKAIIRQPDVNKLNLHRLNKCNKKSNLFLSRLVEIEQVLLRTDHQTAKELIKTINNMRRLVCKYNEEYRIILLKRHGPTYKVPQRNIRICKLK